MSPWRIDDGASLGLSKRGWTKKFTIQLELEGAVEDIASQQPPFPFDMHRCIAGKPALGAKGRRFPSEIQN
ncbi:hypothetical protein E4U21_001461 [Claviceps maximensis]|nr:hypothetical protein E4U21_001461 [Claviceps maximensis]